MAQLMDMAKAGLHAAFKQMLGRRCGRDGAADGIGSTKGQQRAVQRIKPIGGASFMARPHSPRPAEATGNPGRAMPSGTRSRQTRAQSLGRNTTRTLSPDFPPLFGGNSWSVHARTLGERGVLCLESADFAGLFVVGATGIEPVTPPV